MFFFLFFFFTTVIREVYLFQVVVGVLKVGQKKLLESCSRGGTTRFKCHVINSRIMRANKAKECNYGGWAGFCSTCHFKGLLCCLVAVSASLERASKSLQEYGLSLAQF